MTRPPQPSGRPPPRPHCAGALSRWKADPPARRGNLRPLALVRPGVDPSAYPTRGTDLRPSVWPPPCFPSLRHAEQAESGRWRADQAEPRRQQRDVVTPCRSADRRSSPFFSPSRTQSTDCWPLALGIISTAAASRASTSDSVYLQPAVHRDLAYNVFDVMPQRPSHTATSTPGMLTSMLLSSCLYIKPGWFL